MGARTVAGSNDIVMENVCDDGMRNLGGSLLSMVMRAGISVGGVVVVRWE